MARVEERRKAIQLRQQGKTYSEIKQLLKLPKSTLSDWLSKYPLTPDQMVRLGQTIKTNKFLSIEKIRQTKAKKRQKRLQAIYEQEKSFWLPLSEREILLAGLFLYWGEGNKSQRSVVSLNNTDPAMLKFTLFWLLHSLHVPRNKIKFFVHLYQDMNIQQEISFWSNELHIDKGCFSKPYIKKTKKSDLDRKGFGHGTCGMRVGGVVLKEKILMAIRGIGDFYAEKLASI